MKERAQWGSRFGFIMAAVGSAIGLGNIWRFPYQAYDNGGGAFLIPYFFAMLTAGIPLLIIEFGLGKKLRGSAPAVFSRLPGMKGRFQWLGWWQVFLCLAIAAYYTVVIAWIFSYIVFAFTNGWGADPKGFFFNEYLGLPASGNPLDFGGVRWGILASLVLVWGVMWRILYHGVKKGVEKVNRIFMPILIVMVLIIAVRAIFLEGALTGLNYLFKPDFSKILEPKVWISAYGQIFFSMSVCFAIMITYASYLPKKADVVNNAFLTGLINCGFSLLAGVMIFSILGNMAHVEGTTVDKVVSNGPSLVFVTIPAALKYLPLPQVFGPLFFICLAIAGISSAVSLMQSVIAPADEKLSGSRTKNTTLICLIGFALSIPFAMGSGLLLLDITDYFVNQVSVILSALFEIVLVTWALKASRKPNQIYLQNEINEHSDFRAGLWWVICLKYITVGVLGYMAFKNLSDVIINGYGGYPNNAVALFGWAVFAGVLLTGIIFHKIGKPFHKVEGMDL